MTVADTIGFTTTSLPTIRQLQVRKQSDEFFWLTAYAESSILVVTQFDDAGRVSRAEPFTPATCGCVFVKYATPLPVGNETWSYMSRWNHK